MAPLAPLAPPSPPPMITGNGATIMCNNSGGVYCESCSDAIIEGITWDECYTSPLLFSALSTNCAILYNQDISYQGYGSHTIYISNVMFMTTDSSRILKFNV